ncbi:TrmH family RNA methyltransferase [Saccharopolyspora indica]|uniref:TrmH family RNA methyltransferase n=1 Tax=Saccharopolyspora indica TaxID=1229659 RepID=UPI0038CD8FD8
MAQRRQRRSGALLRAAPPQAVLTPEGPLSPCGEPTDFGSRAVFVLGSETAGLSEEVQSRIAQPLAIPMAGDVESLNVASAAAVLCFELLRRKLS